MWNVTEACDELTEAPAVPFDGVCYSRNSSPAPSLVRLRGVRSDRYLEGLEVTFSLVSVGFRILCQGIVELIVRSQVSGDYCRIAGLSMARARAQPHKLA